MKQMIDCVLLIDDDHPTNFLHTVILEDSECVQHIESALSVKEALGMLDTVKPDIIFLDLNMPALTGWDFIDRFKKIEFDPTKKPLVYILTTSENPDDLKRAGTINEISGFMIKPISEEMINEIIEKHFEEG